MRWSLIKAESPQTSAGPLEGPRREDGTFADAVRRKDRAVANYKKRHPASMSGKKK